MTSVASGDRLRRAALALELHAMSGERRIDVGVLVFRAPFENFDRLVDDRDLGVVARSHEVLPDGGDDVERDLLVRPVDRDRDRRVLHRDVKTLLERCHERA